MENIESNELSLVFSKIVSKGLCCDKVWGISIFPSCTPIRGIYRKSLLKAVYVHFIYMKKFLDCDWLREMQFFGNTVQKKGNLVQKRVTNVTF